MDDDNEKQKDQWATRGLLNKVINDFDITKNDKPRLIAQTVTVLDSIIRKIDFRYHERLPEGIPKPSDPST